MDLGIEGKTALVVAGTRGLGRATAMALAAEGVRVLVSARDEESLRATAAELSSRGVEVATLVADITDPEAPSRLVEATVERFGTVDILIANAGGPPAGRSLEVGEEALVAALNANLLSAIRLVDRVVPLMRTSGWGRICCISSYSVVQPIPTLALSNTARAALWAWVQTAAQDLAAEGSGITLNLVCPGPHATDRMRELGGSGRMGDPADFGSVAAFLCSEQANFVTGMAMLVDGGATLAL
jgi:3-oxoacyl-[acyl-carrier protein] reductase